MTDFSEHHADRRAHPRTKVSVPTELHLPNQETPMQEQTSDLSLGGCYVKTLVSILCRDQAGCQSLARRRQSDNQRDGRDLPSAGGQRYSVSLDASSGSRSSADLS